MDQVHIPFIGILASLEKDNTTFPTNDGLAGRRLSVIAFSRVTGLDTSRSKYIRVARGLANYRWRSKLVQLGHFGVACDSESAPTLVGLEIRCLSVLKSADLIVLWRAHRRKIADLDGAGSRGSRGEELGRREREGHSERGAEDGEKELGMHLGR